MYLLTPILSLIQENYVFLFIILILKEFILFNPEMNFLKLNYFQFLSLLNIVWKPFVCQGWCI